jgi:hypothetical protein
MVCRCRNSNSCFSFWWKSTSRNFSNTESYDGTSWTEVNDLNTARMVLVRSWNLNFCFSFWWKAIPAGPYRLTESWNGTSWTEVNDLNTARFFGQEQEQIILQL